MNNRFRYWMPALVVAIVISLFSTHYFSSQQTARVIIPVLHRLFPFAAYRTLSRMHTAIRKIAHVAEFGVFSATVFHGVRGNRPGWRWDWAGYTLLIAVGFAGLDEWHQSFVPLREARFRDVLIDSTGALLAQVLVWVYAKIDRNSPGQAPASDAPRSFGSSPTRL